MTLSVVTTFAQENAPPIEAGVSQTLARWRAANYSNVRYKLNITLEKGAPLMRGDIEIRVNLTENGAKNDLILDWRTTQFANDKDKPYARIVTVNTAADFLSSETKEHIIIPRQVLKTGENFIKLSFASPIKTSGAGVTRYVDKEDGAEYVYSLFVPSDASTAFPVFDQPDLKARFQLNLSMPFGWKVVSNTDLVENSHPPITDETISKKVDNKDAFNFHFNQTEPISTYVFAFAAGNFEEFYDENVDNLLKELDKEKRSKGEVDKKGQTSISVDEIRKKRSKIYVRKSQAEKFEQHAAEVFRLNREGVKFLENYFDYKFPFPKYDLVLIPEFPFGGMEHAGCTFLREDRVIFPTEPTKNDYITRANVIFHEAAHQWFGDTVTMRWFDDLWLKEGFAEFMAYKTLEKVMPEYNAWKIFYERNKQAAYLTDSTRGTTPIYQEIPNLSAAKSAYGNIVYRKAPSFLRQAEFYLGEDKFQTAVRAFLKKHEFKNAEWTDLVKEFETASKQDLKDWANVWVKQKGLPIVTLSRTELKTKTDKGEQVFTSYGLKMLARVYGSEDCGNWQMKTKMLYSFPDSKTETEVVELPEPLNCGATSNFMPTTNSLEGTLLEEEKGKTVKVENRKSPNFVFPNYQDYGYGIFLLDERSRAYVLENIQREKDDFLRTMMWGALWDSVRETELNPKDYVELVIKNLGVESDESTIQTLLGRVSTAMNYYLSDAQSKELAPQIENLLIDKMQNAPTLGQRITFYRAFLNVASSEKARSILKDILSGKLVIKELQLKSKDRFDIMTRLAIVGDKDGEQMIYKYFATDLKLTDEEKRYAFAAAAGIPSKEIKEKYFNDFLNNKDISESYIETAFVPFNSVRHSELTLPYLERALAELPNLKKNRKIFFVNGWLAAFIGGQKSEQALAMVNKFLADNPTLDNDLRLKILENVDALERAVKIRAKFGK